MGRRPERLAEGLREEVARIVSSELKDPRLGFITITRVEVTHDLGLARVLVSVLGDDTERQRSMAALQSATGFVRREIGRRLRIRVVPEIEFRYDKGIDATDRVARLLEEQRDGHGADGAAPGPEASVSSDDGPAADEDADANEARDDEPTGSR